MLPNGAGTRGGFFQRIKRGYTAIPAKSNSTAAPHRQVTEISPGTACNSFRALPRLRRAQTGRKKAPYPQIVYLLIRTNNWAEFIISRVPVHRPMRRRCVVVARSFFLSLRVCLFLARAWFYSHRAIGARARAHTRAHTNRSSYTRPDIFECPF